MHVQRGAGRRAAARPPRRGRAGRACHAGGMLAELGIAVIHYRTPEVALDCLARLRRAAPAARVVVVDTAPDTAFEARLRRGFPEVGFVAAANHSYSHAVNVGLARLERPLLVQMNADVLVEPGTLRALVAALEADPACGAVGPLARTPTGAPQPLGAPYQRHYRALARAARRAAAAPPPAGAPPASVPVPWLSGCLQLIRREAWEASGGYDESFRFFNEDMDFCFRLRALGYACRLVDAPALHLGGASTPGHPAFHVEGRRGGFELSRRYRSAPYRAAHLAFLWGEALLGRLTSRAPERRAAHRAMLALLRRRAWHASPFGATLDDRSGLLSDTAGERPGAERRLL